MANPEHIKLLRQGVEVWNRWRKEHPEIKPDLNYADFSTPMGSSVIDHRADLIGANLSGVWLAHARLEYAELKSANLSYAILNGSDLSNANLNSANLDHAGLGGVNFQEANLSDTDFNGAALGGTIFANANLANAKHLNTCFHGSPSSIDFRTIIISGNLPKIFFACLWFARECY